MLFRSIERFRDSYFPASYAEIKDYFVELRHEISPELVFSHRREDQHQDHRLVAELTWNTFRDHLIFEYEIPKFEGDLGQPNTYVSLAEETCLSKVTSIVESFPSQRSKKLFSSGTLWALMRLRGLEADSMSEFAESFHCRKLIL